MKMIFPGKTAVYVSYSYSKEHSCKKSEKSLGRLSGNFADGRTDTQTNQQMEAWAQLSLRTVTPYRAGSTTELFRLTQLIQLIQLTQFVKISLSWAFLNDLTDLTALTDLIDLIDLCNRSK